MNYTRTLPRDLFNEANLLAGVGHLILALRILADPEWAWADSVERFDIAYDGDVSIYVANLGLEYKGERVRPYVQLNDRDPLPLRAQVGDDYYKVFTAPGVLNGELLAALRQKF